MEEDKKKRKSNKKKNKKQQQQAKAAAAAAADDTSSNAGETSSQDQNHGVNGDRDNDSKCAVEESVAFNSNADLSSKSADSEKQKWLQEEARLRDMVKQLLYEKDSYIQRQADMELRITQLQCEKASWHEKEVGLEQRIGLLVQEKANLSLEEGHLQEKIRHIEKEKFVLVEEENSIREQNATLSNENTSLRMQVLELEGARLSLSQENKHLLDNISVLESRIQDLERSLTSALPQVDGQKDTIEKEDLNAQIEGACTLIEKLVIENADLVEKMNELYMELNRGSVVPDVTSVAMPDYPSGPDPVAGSGEDGSLSRSTKHFETVPVVDLQTMNNGLDSDYTNAGSSETTVYGEIVQISLDEKEAHDLEAQASPDEGEEGVPITDAPLIGAPFRLVSFVTKYVSGADLVNKSSSNS